jgi:hypothetical protein
MRRKGLKIKSRVNLSGQDLSGADLRFARLREANLCGTNLSRADLTGANLTGANLTGANLTGANLSLAKMKDANLTGAIIEGAALPWGWADEVIVDSVGVSGDTPEPVKFFLPGSNRLPPVAWRLCRCGKPITVRYNYKRDGTFGAIDMRVCQECTKWCFQCHQSLRNNPFHLRTGQPSTRPSVRNLFLTYGAYHCSESCASKTGYWDGEDL